MLGTEECAGGMGQSGQKRNAAGKGVQNMLTKEEYVKGTGRTAIHKTKTNLLHLDQNLGRLMQLKPYRISVLPGLPLETKRTTACLKR